MSPPTTSRPASRSGAPTPPARTRRCWSIPRTRPHLGKPIGANSSLDSWEGDQWQIGGGTTWGWYSYDPELDLVYYGTGNPGTWNPAQRPGDNKWSMTIFARDPDDGMAKWVYQKTPHDEWDFDGVNENILVDQEIDGQERKLLVNFDRNGIGYTLDRETGELLVAEKFDPAVNWTTGVDMDPNSETFGRPAVVAAMSTEQNGEDVNTTGVCPAALGTKDQQPAAFSPKTGLFYVPTNHVCMDYEPFRVSYTAGQPYVGATLSMFPAPDSHGGMGNFIAWDATKGEIKWSLPEQFSVWSGALATAGDIVFYGTLEGYLKAVDSDDRRGALQVQDPVGDHRQRHDLRARRQAVCRRALGCRRLGRHRPRGRADLAGGRRGLAERGRPRGGGPGARERRAQHRHRRSRRGRRLCGALATTRRSAAS